MVRRVCTNAIAAFDDRVLLVVGHEYRRVITAAGNDCRFIVVNERYANGIGTSVAKAAMVLSDCSDAIVIVLADQPKIPLQHLRAMQRIWSGSDTEIVVTIANGTLTPPVLLPSAAYADLVRLEGDSGARELLHDCRYAHKVVRCDAAAQDVDTPEDLAQLD